MSNEIKSNFKQFSKKPASAIMKLCYPSESFSNPDTIGNPSQN